MYGWASQPSTFRLVRLVLLCFLCTLQSVWATAPIKYGLMVGLDTEILSLGPFAHNHAGNAVIDWLIHDQLFFRDAKTLRPIPNLAESLKPIDDVTWEIKMRPGIRFHNGEPVDAAAVKFTLDHLSYTQQQSPYRAAFAWVKEVELVTDLILRVYAHRPLPSLADVLTRLHILPPRYLAEVGEDRFAEAPVGAGPYRVSAWKRGGLVTLKANDDYWGGPKGRPAIRTIAFQTIQDPVERFNRLLSGELHIVRGITIDQAMLLDHAGIARVSAKPTPRMVFLLMDGDGRAGKTPLMDRRVRRAISYAIPTEEMINTALHKFAVRAPGGLTPLHSGYDATIQPRPFDLQKARALLQEAGYAEGFELPVNFSPAMVLGGERLSASLMDNLGKVGIKVKIRRFADAYEYYTQFRQGKLEGLSLLAWGNGASFDADAVLYPLFRSGQPLVYNTNADADKLLDEGRATIDPEKRKAIYSALQKVILDQAYWVPLYGQYILEGVNRKLDYEASSDELMYLFSAAWKENSRDD